MVCVFSPLRGHGYYTTTSPALSISLSITRSISLTISRLYPNQYPCQIPTDPLFVSVGVGKGYPHPGSACNPPKGAGHGGDGVRVSPETLRFTVRLFIKTRTITPDTPASEVYAYHLHLYADGGHRTPGCVYDRNSYQVSRNSPLSSIADL